MRGRATGRGPARRSVAWVSVAAFALSTVLAACGSRLPPDVLAQAKQREQGSGPVGGATDVSPAASPGSTADAGTGGSGDGSSGTAAGGNGGGSGSGGGGVAGRCPGGRGGSTDTGVTSEAITIANVADVSGPQPGVFESAQQAVKAYVGYVNSRGGVCGRRLELVSYDSRTDAGGDREAAARACRNAFAVVGSMSGFDSGGARTVADCGIPDLRAAAVTPARQNSPVTFGTNSTQVNLVARVLPDYFRSRFPRAAENAAFLYLDAGTAEINSRSFMAAYERRGFTWVYRQAVDITDFNYAPYVVEMKERGVRFVQFQGTYQHAVRLANAMRQQGFRPQAYVLDPTAYDPRYVRTGGAAVDGTYVYLNSALFEEAAGNAEMRQYQTWLRRVAPGAEPTWFGIFAWSAAKLFVELTAEIGADLTRERLVGAVRGVHGWTADGLHAPHDVGGKRTSGCLAFAQLRRGDWVRRAPGRGWSCGPLIDTGIGR